MIGNRRTEYLPSTLSWSKVSKYSECSERYRLSYAMGFSGSTWFATLAGTAIHEITEYADRREAEGILPEHQLDGAPTFQEVFDREIADMKEQGREVKASGKLLKSVGKTGGPNKKDYAWWLDVGPKYVKAWMDWKQVAGYSILILEDGTPAIEVGFEIEMGEGIPPLVGYIDRVYVTQTEQGFAALVLDLKSGQTPQHPLQLCTYRLGLQGSLGIDAEFGAFWSPSGHTYEPDPEDPEKRVDRGFGGMSQIYILPNYPLDQVKAMYLNAWRGIEAGIFIPHPNSMCNGCDMKKYCWAVNGHSSDRAGIPAIPVARPEEEEPISVVADEEIGEDD